eukprot:m51a1_g543 hypothetical protein (209) ;mRNA; r:425912-426646
MQHERKRSHIEEWYVGPGVTSPRLTGTEEDSPLLAGLAGLLSPRAWFALALGATEWAVSTAALVMLMAPVQATLYFVRLASEYAAVVVAFGMLAILPAFGLAVLVVCALFLAPAIAVSLAIAVASRFVLPRSYRIAVCAAVRRTWEAGQFLRTPVGIALSIVLLPVLLPVVVVTGVVSYSLTLIRSVFANPSLPMSPVAGPVGTPATF